MSEEKALQRHKINAFNRDRIEVLAEVKEYDYEDVAYARCDDYHLTVDGDGDSLISLDIHFQCGPVSDGINGITDEALLAIILDRLEYFQSSPFRCRQNALAITKIEEALHWLRDRAMEGTNTP